MRLARTFVDKQWTEPLPVLAWLIEHPDGLIVVDTGETARTAEPGYFPRWHPYFRTGVREWVSREDEIDRGLAALGFDVRDVSRLVMTHLHTDHAGGLHHFSASEVIISRAELAAASGRLGRLRGYLNRRFPAWLVPTLVDFTDGPVGPFERSQSLTPAGDVLLVPTPGHSPGQLGVIVDEGERVVFIAGDASYTEHLMLEQAIDGVAPDETAARETLAKIHALVSAVETVYLPSHDPGSQARLARRQPTDVRAKRQIPSPSPAPA
jgi:glyoxylase-like metal-dependent hydrolase (beta-lactamase superfamily II)